MNNTEPRIFIVVTQLIGERRVESRKEISLMLWRRANHPGSLAAREIDNALAEVRQACGAAAPGGLT